MSDAVEVRHSPIPRFSDAAHEHAARNVGLLLANASINQTDEVIAAEAAVVALGSVEVVAEFDAACLSAWRSGQETAIRDLAEHLRERADQLDRLEAELDIPVRPSGDPHPEAMTAIRYRFVADLIERQLEAHDGRA